jgi:F-type H+-transporting ATPase subunit gamma
MANLKAIRNRISSVKSTRQITSAMKMVSAAKLRKAQDKIVRLRPYADALHGILIGVNKSLQGSDNENVYGKHKNGNGKVLIVVITSNKGLCGAFNTNVIKETKRIMAEKYPDKFRAGKLSFIAIGKKGFDALKRMNSQVFEEYNSIFNNLDYNHTCIIAENLIKRYVSGEFDQIEFVYNQFKNAAVQRLTNEIFLPVQDVTDDKGNENVTDYIFEPDVVNIIEELIPKSLKIQLYKAVLDSYVAEQGAQMTAMHQATENATDLIHDLTLQYNKARQASITNQLLEVVSGAEALKG